MVRFVVVTLEVKVAAMVGCEVMVIASVVVKDAQEIMHMMHVMMISLNCTLVASRVTYMQVKGTPPH